MTFESAILAYDYLVSWIYGKFYKYKSGKALDFNQELLDAYK